MTLSTLCVIHCLAFPLLTVLLPNLATNSLNQEFFDIAMVICVLPISIYALTMGYKKHMKYSIAITGSLGLLTLVAALFFGEKNLGEIGEKLWIVIGSVIIAFAHFRNFQLCQQSDKCSC